MNIKGLERVVYGSIGHIGKTTLLLALMSSSSGAQDRSTEIPGDAPVTCMAFGICPPSEPDPGVKCIDLLESYKERISAPDSIFDDSVVNDINKILASEDKCEDKVIQIESVLNAYWASEPWCRKDRKLFFSLYTEKIVAQIPTSSQETISALLKQDPLSCSETLAAAVTIVRLFNPGFSLYPEGPSVISNVGNEGNSGVASATKRDLSNRAILISRRRQLKTASQRLRSCRAKVSKLSSKK
jgi:hypothetical protein